MKVALNIVKIIAINHSKELVSNSYQLFLVSIGAKIKTLLHLKVINNKKQNKMIIALMKKKDKELRTDIWLLQA